MPGVGVSREAESESLGGIASGSRTNVGASDEFVSSLDEVKSIVSSLSEQKTNRKVAFLTSYGLPIAVAAGLFAFVFEEVSDPWKGTAINEGGLLWMLGVAIAGMIAVRLYLWVGRKRDFRSIRDRRKQ